MSKNNKGSKDKEKQYKAKNHKKNNGKIPGFGYSKGTIKRFNDIQKLMGDAHQEKCEIVTSALEDCRDKRQSDLLHISERTINAGVKRGALSELEQCGTNRVFRIEGTTSILMMIGEGEYILTDEFCLNILRKQKVKNMLAHDTETKSKKKVHRNRARYVSRGTYAMEPLVLKGFQGLAYRNDDESWPTHHRGYTWDIRIKMICIVKKDMFHKSHRRPLRIGNQDQLDIFIRWVKANESYDLDVQEKQ